MTFYILTFGCQQNIADSERISLFLKNCGAEETSSLNKADIFVINSCSVRQAAEDKVYGLANKVKDWRSEARFYHSEGTPEESRDRKLVILTGCMPGSALGERRRFPLGYLRNKAPWVDYFLTTESFFDKGLQIIASLYPEVVKKDPQTFQKNSNLFSKTPYLVPITSGCDNFCSYCVVPYAREAEKSRSFKEIFCEVAYAVNHGVREIILLGQNVNSYGKGLEKKDLPCPLNNNNVSIQEYKESFPRLLACLCEIPELEKISFMTSHPKDMSDELISIIAKFPKVSKDIHLPIQSGDDEILKKMNRNYTVSHYLSLVKKLKGSVKDLRLTTDVIVGFPGETKKQFENTKKIFQQIGFDDAFIAMYSPRPGTLASKIEDSVPKAEKKRRHKELFALVRK